MRNRQGWMLRDIWCVVESLSANQRAIFRANRLFQQAASFPRRPEPRPTHTS